MSRYSGGSLELNGSYRNIDALENISKRLPTKGLWQINYGYDHSCGYFIQFFAIDRTAKNNCGELSYKGNDCIDIDSLFGGLTGLQLGLILKNLSLKVPEHHIDSCFLDMGF